MKHYKNIKKYKQFIIVEESGHPLAWSHGDSQLCQCTNETWDDKHFPLQSYTYEEALAHIRVTIENRKKWKMYSETEKYLLMPVDMETP